jgi:hypothetical protein
MVRINETQKKEINGGIAPMMLWVVITGACLAVSTIAGLVQNAVDSSNASTTSNSSTNDARNYTKSNQKGFIRISPKMSSSAFFLPI